MICMRLFESMVRAPVHAQPTDGELGFGADLSGSCPNGQFSAAARNSMHLQISEKRISLLESAYQTTLMTRHVDGVRLTREGLQVLEAAKRMEEASFGLDRTLNQATSKLTARCVLPLRRIGYVLGCAKAGRISAGLSWPAGRPEMRDAFSRRASS